MHNVAENREEWVIKRFSVEFDYLIFKKDVYSFSQKLAVVQKGFNDGEQPLQNQFPASVFQSTDEDHAIE
jgi:hypothetical protein